MAPTGQKSKVCQLLEAALRGNLRRLQALGAELDDGRGVEKTIASVRDPLNRSALHFAAMEGYTDICNYLVEKVYFDINVQDSKGKTPLQNAVEERRMSTVSYLLKKGADPNMSAENGFGPLHSAAEQGEAELLHVLLSKGANVDSFSRDGTPLQMAATHGKPEAVKVLLDHYANPGIFFHHIPTPLSAAIKSKSLRCVELLLEAEADPDAVSCGATPLHYAVSGGETEMIRCLLKAGADPNETNKDGMTPLEVAALNGNRQDVTVLYPVTSRIKSYSDWSVDGIMRPTNSNEAKEHRNFKKRERFEKVKSKGLQAFHKKDYDGAIVWFTKAMEEDACDASVLSNRSLCFALKNQGDLALKDAKACILLKPDWPKAHYREGAAWNILGKFDQAAIAFGEGLKRDPENKELQSAFQEANAKSTKK